MPPTNNTLMPPTHHTLMPPTHHTLMPPTHHIHTLMPSTHHTLMPPTHHMHSSITGTAAEDGGDKDGGDKDGGDKDGGDKEGGNTSSSALDLVSRNVCLPGEHVPGSQTGTGGISCFTCSTSSSGLETNTQAVTPGELVDQIILRSLAAPKQPGRRTETPSGSPLAYSSSGYIWNLE
ncbi:hypothetical protein EYF80_023792 [Liparis tanakae]|uniref:Uncharacterized protein n=1 Tax=Liparis tanakae TaxID=230148 RepID=A0A4Z2HJU1_9TELE|nr:hypothetical protein EYF80_023792 [Liparis tanakae]